MKFFPMKSVLVGAGILFGANCTANAQVAITPAGPPDLSKLEIPGIDFGKQHSAEFIALKKFNPELLAALFASEGKVTALE